MSSPAYSIVTTCRSCGSSKKHNLIAEINLHFPGMRGLNIPTVWSFPEVQICVSCGFVEFSLSRDELLGVSEMIRSGERLAAES